MRISDWSSDVCSSDLSWIDIAAEWALGDLPPDATVPLRLLGAGFDLAVADAPSILHQACSARVWCDVVNGDLDDRIRTASITFGRAPHVALAAGGPGCADHALLARYDRPCQVPREMAPDGASARVDLAPRFEGSGRQGGRS